MSKEREQRGPEPRMAGKAIREESLAVGEEAIEIQKEEPRAEGQTPAEVLQELEALMAALREANGHLVMANLRSQSLADQLNELYEEAKTAIQAKDDFFALISHELRTPLTSISGWAALLERQPDTPTAVEAARSIANSASVQAKLIDDLLDVSRIMTGKFAITEERVDLWDVIDKTVSEMRPMAAAKGLTLRVTVEVEESIIIHGDGNRLSQVLGNLLSNAMKFTPRGGLIQTCLTRDGGFAVIEVADTGEGIPADFLPYVFDRRAQATNKRFAGLGLGLAIVKHIVELHGGSVEAASEGEGRGAMFTIRIPIAE